MKVKVWVVGLMLGAALVSTGWAQYATGFDSGEGYVGDADGEDLNGQNSWYNPVPATSISFKTYTYAGNVYAIPAPPTGGGDQLAIGTGPAGSIFARSQLDIAYGDGTGVWKVEYDIYVTFTGTLPTTQNAGSYSTQTFPGDNTCIMLTEWTDPATAATWDASMVWFNAADAQLQEKVTGQTALATNTWHHRWMTMDLTTNQVTEVGVKNLTTEVTAVYNPTDRYLDGGSAGTGPPPDGLRLFAGSASVAGNTLAFDNLSTSKVIPPPPTGACCAAEGSCTEETEEDCAGAGGTYQGDGTTCDPNTCPQPDPCAENACVGADPCTFTKLVCKPGGSKLISKGKNSTPGDNVCVTDESGAFIGCAVVNDRGKWKNVERDVGLGAFTRQACGTSKSTDCLP